MGVRKLGPGRWEGSYRDPQRRERIKIFRTRAEADRWLATTAHLRAKTRVGYESDLRVHVLPVFAHRPVGSIQQVGVRRFVSDMIANGAAPGTVRNARKLLRLVLGTAEGSGAIRTNPCNGVRVPASPKAEMVYLSPEQVETLAVAIGPRFATLVRLAAYTGLRAGEICALRVGRLDLLRGRILVAESVTEVEGHGLVFGEPKTNERRSVTLPVFLRDELGAHLAGRDTGPDDFVFPSSSGGVLRHKMFYKRVFKPAVMAAGLPTSMRFHDLRHTCAHFASPWVHIRRRFRSASATRRSPSPSTATVTSSRSSTRRSPSGSTRSTRRWRMRSAQ
jgi:integrase